MIMRTFNRTVPAVISAGLILAVLSAGLMIALTSFGIIGWE